MSKWITALLISLLSLPSMAGQFKTMKDIEVHYIAFNSTFLTPKIARSYDIKAQRLQCSAEHQRTRQCLSG